MGSTMTGPSAAQLAEERHGLTDAQMAQLLKPIAKQRVMQDGKGHSHLAQQDVTAHLIRMFGFGGFDTQVLDVQCVFERERLKDGKPTDRYDVCYRALLRLTVKDRHGNVIGSYEDGSTATAQNQTLGDAHDLAYKSALSLAKKRCAINLGDQFGLSLYNKGQTSALVIATLVGMEPADGDVQDDVPQQVALGNDETDYEPGGEQEPANQANQIVGLRTEIRRLGEARGLTVGEIGDDFAQWSQGMTIPGADAALLAKYRNHLQALGQATP